MHYEDLKLLMKCKNISEKQLAKLSGIDYHELGRKLKGDVEFTLWEIKCIAQIFSLTGRQILHIFF